MATQDAFTIALEAYRKESESAAAAAAKFEAEQLQRQTEATAEAFRSLFGFSPEKIVGYHAYSGKLTLLFVPARWEGTYKLPAAWYVYVPCTQCGEPTLSHRCEHLFEIGRELDQADKKSTPYLCEKCNPSDI